MAYCTASDVELYININQVPDINSVIAAAQDKVDRYCRDIFEPRQMAVYTEANRAHFAELPYTTQSVDSIIALPSGTELSETSWALENYTRPIIRFALEMPFNFLVVGLEPWNTDVDGLLRVQVNGTFGYAETPFVIRNATALLAAAYIHLSGLGELKDKAQQVIGQQANIETVNVEGYSVSFFEESAPDLTRSTGFTGIDKFLAPFRRKNIVKAG